MPLSKEQNSKEIEAAIQAFKAWRSSREKMCRIPDRLWKIAAKLSRQYPISTICENLGLNWWIWQIWCQASRFGARPVPGQFF